MSLPEVREVRSRIESVKHKPYQIYLKSLYLCGAARAVEMAAKRCSGEKENLIYGPRGSDVWLSETDPPDLTNTQFLKILLQVNSREKRIDEVIDELSQRVKVAVFRIRIAKQKLEENEEPPYRLVALPMPRQYEPWTQEIYDYFHDKGDEYVFPWNRQTIWHYITNVQPIFKDLTYRIKKYTFMKSGQLSHKILSHNRPFKLHALRHVRTDELISRFHFDGIDLGAYVGWSMGRGSNSANMPAMAGNYAEIREAWPRYIKKLCLPSLTVERKIAPKVNLTVKRIEPPKVNYVLADFQYQQST
jgi:hypothetical protein